MLTSPYAFTDDLGRSVAAISTLDPGTDVPLGLCCCRLAFAACTPRCLPFDYYGLLHANCILPYSLQLADCFCHTDRCARCQARLGVHAQLLYWAACIPHDRLTSPRCPTFLQLYIYDANELHDRLHLDVAKDVSRGKVDRCSLPTRTPY